MTRPLDVLLVAARGAYLLIRRGRKSIALLTVPEARTLARDLLMTADDIAPRTGFEHTYAADGHGSCRQCGRPPAWPEHETEK